METSELLDALEYSSSKNYVPAARLSDVPEHAHIFRRAVRSCSLHGVYVLREGDAERRLGSAIPVVYVAEAASKTEADEIHRRVWNQDIVPFLIVRTPNAVHVYSGFLYRERSKATDPRQQGVLDAAESLQEVLSKLHAFRASAIDTGLLWGSVSVDASSRVDWRLLDGLRRLDVWLRRHALPSDVSHALIGKFVYLRYLKDRGILSERRLQEWGIDSQSVFSRDCRLSALRVLIEHVDEWLNGSVFPLRLSGKSAPRAEHVQRVASVFLGDDLDSGQLHLNFRAYDFSHIPIETLSAIYEQFLALDGKSRDLGAFYTPIPLVNFMLAELNEQRPMRVGMKVLDPSCGSGAFLVQCFRRLVELQTSQNRGRIPRPTELRDLLVRHIFGVDRDADACRVAELSLILTMLDYIEPPDLISTPKFRLPNLHNQNIFEGDFFDPDSAWHRAASDTRYDWIVGNPPWLEIGQNKESEFHASRWVAEHADTYPIAGNQVGEAFAWKAATHVTSTGRIALLLPALTLVRADSRAFRSKFFKTMEVSAVANFSNLREVLFAGRARLPAAALFYAPLPSETKSTGPILVFSPMVINQEANRPRPGERQETWNISVNHSEIREVRVPAIEDGNNIPWRMAMWASPRDERLLETITRRFPTLAQVAHRRSLAIHEGPQLRARRDAREPLDAIPEVIGKRALVPERLRGMGTIHAFPEGAFELVDATRGFVRKGRGDTALKVCRAPHVIVSATRAYAVYSDDFVVVPARQIGIAGDSSDATLLKALAVFLSSEFVRYHQFLISPQADTRGRLATLSALLSLPTPIDGLTEKQLRRWSDLHEELVNASHALAAKKTESPLLFESGSSEGEREPRLERLHRDLNQLVYDAMGIKPTEQVLVEDFVRVKMSLIDGQVGEPAVRQPSEQDLFCYGTILRRELDEFLDAEGRRQHDIAIVSAPGSGMVQIGMPRPNRAISEPIQVRRAAGDVDAIIMRLQEQLSRHRQWLYFDRNLFLYDGDDAFVLKPMQMLWWTRTQALLDADEIIAAMVSFGSESSTGS
jgi:methylase of polypeptide subunit release factors